MRFFLFALLSFAFAASASAASEPKKPKPVDIKKEIVDKCGTIPYGLVDLNGKSATKDEMEEGKFQVTAFITQVDVFQDCLLKVAKSLEVRLSDNDRRVLAAAIDQSQSEKVAVGAAFNNAVCEYNFANNIPDKECKDGKLKAAASEPAPAQPAGAAGKPAAKKPATATTPTAKPKTTP